MDLIQRPKKVQKAERGYLSNEKYQDYAENQFKTIYDYLDSMILEKVYPIGSYYWSSEDTDPSTLFGGTWEQVKDKFILALGDTYTTAGATGGSAFKTIAKTNLPNYNLVAPLKKAAGPSGSGWEWLSPSGNDNNVNIPSGGSGTPLDIMPPYEVAYCWKRIK